MFKNQYAPRTINRPAPTRPGLVYTQRGNDFARLIATAKTVTR
ncbi:hypothetical protein [Arthrobacter sp. NPDC056493]